MGKDGEMLLVKTKKRKIKMKRTFTESIAVCESSSEFEKGLEIQEGKVGERLLAKAKKRKIKENRTSDESIGACESPEFVKGPKTQKVIKDGERLLGKTKIRKIKENRASNESISVYRSSEFEKKPTAPKGKDGKRLLVKDKKRKIKMNRISDESIGACESPSELEKTPKIQKGKNDERLLVKHKKRKRKENIISEESDRACEFPIEFEKEPKTQKGRRSTKVDSWQNPIQSEIFNEIDSFIEPDVIANESKTKTRKFKKSHKDKKKHLTNVKESDIEEVESVVDEIPSVDDDCTRGMKSRRSTKVDSWQNPIQSEILNEFDSSIEPDVIANESKTKTRKFKKSNKDKKNHLTNVKESDIEEVESVADEIPSVDDDCTRGMKKWLTQYKESRPGLKVLQQRIDDFVTAHEERLEQERKEREALAAEDGWTVVVHQKGRKKTTDAETGTAVGSVAPAAVMDKISKKKNKEIALDFYRFQKREAKRNEVMMLQSKFEQDKKRIQQLRAARKFRPG